ncbi:MAG: dienelactone hydrolase family protein [Holophagaceae bacterium]|nr:dienelactone hydrolase family protein [Holophagaceae bacterium]
MAETRTLNAATVGRYLVEPASHPAPGGAAPLLVGFHGYGQNAEMLLDELRRIPGAGAWTLVSVQALHRFYNTKTQEVVGSWMTSLDRHQAIGHNLAYVRSVVSALRAEGEPGNLVFMGFSQGAAMAWRAAAGCGLCDGLIVLGGDLPKDVAEAADLALPPVLLARGEADAFYGSNQFEKDLAVLGTRGVPVESLQFKGGHEWSQAFREATGRFLQRVLA